MSPELQVRTTAIPGLLVVTLPVHSDSRGWFKENWQREKMLALGLPDFGPVQNNISFNQKIGTTRGIHAEPWDKYVSVASGSVFGAWVDLREGPTFGKVHTEEIDPSVAVLVPRGVGNAYQTLTHGTSYTYLVNEHWSPEAEYTFLNLADETVAIDWPIPLDSVELSAKDRQHPRLADVTPMRHRGTLILGANGQLGAALRPVFRDRSQYDLAQPNSVTTVDWGAFDTVINAAAFTDVDGAETPEGRGRAWQINVDGVRRLVEACRQHRLMLVHVSSDYVFDGLSELHDESENPSPLGVYGQTKAAGEALVSTLPRHYIVRTSWVVGAGKNFVRTMMTLARRGVAPRVVSDQVGRLTFADDLALAIRDLLTGDAEPGVYNVTNSGEAHSWAEYAKAVFVLVGADPDAVSPVSTAEYYANQEYAPRPLNRTLDLRKIESVGISTRNALVALEDFVSRHPLAD